MHFGLPAEIFGMDGVIILIVVVVVLFGSTQIPKLARSLGSAQKEFKKGLDEGGSEHPPNTAPAANTAPAGPAANTAPAGPAATTAPPTNGTTSTPS